MMNTKYMTILPILALLMVAISCTKMDTRIDTQFTDAHIQSNYQSVRGFGFLAYAKVRNGFYSLDNNLFAAATDEAEQTASSSSAQLFNNGSWNAFNNPDNVYYSSYEGIRAVNYFLDYSVNYKTLLAHNRDTLNDNGLQYRRDVADIAFLRAENRVLRAYFYFELLKRYGAVPLVTEVLSIDDNTDLPRNSFDEVLAYIISEIDAVRNSLQVNWKSYDASLDGRLTVGAALALKSRILLYAASPLNNTGNTERWQQAAQSAHDVIALQQYSLHPSYSSLFVGDQTAKSAETIWAIRQGANNALEHSNYPIGTPGGKSGVTPSHNLVSAYEYIGPVDPANPYANRDPRLQYSIVYNNSSWNGRTIEVWNGGQDSPTRSNTSRTGYYLKKFLNEKLNLTQEEAKLRSWIVFRYGEILLNYAEAMNEAYGPDQANGFTLTARQALQLVRDRADAKLPPAVANNQGELRERIKHERRIELAFEDHRFWDLLRWKDAQVLNEPLMGIQVTKTLSGNFEYTPFRVENRVFDASRMYLYPIPQDEISKSANVLQQNPGW